MTRMFIMLGRAVRVAANSVFKIVCVDAGFLKGEYEGQIIVLSTKDSDNRLVMAAFAIADKENADNYAYLFREAKKNPEMAAFLNSPDTTIYADGHLGTPVAKARELPQSQFRNCVKHLIGNLNKGIGPNVTLALFEASKTPHSTTFNKIMEETVLSEMPHAYQHFMKLDKALWTHHASCQTTRVADQSTTNLAESNMQWLSADVSA
ncbi:unnamed protein product [Pylaiella littoralis]